VRIAFCLGVAFVWLPLWFVVSEFKATSEQSALTYPHFSVVNNIAVLVVELAGITLVLSAVSRSHWLLSSLSIFSTLCGVLVVLGLLLQLSAKLGLIR
jgi:hypothetical protein